MSGSLLELVIIALLILVNGVFVAAEIALITVRRSRLRQLIAREPSAFLYFTLGNLYADQGQWPGAQQAYFQAYQSQPDNPDYAFNLAVGLEHLGQTRQALDYYRKALDLSFRKGRANFDQSLVIQRVGQLSLAFGLGTGAGFILATVMLAALQDRLADLDAPEPFRGLPLLLLTLAILSMAFMGFTGLGNR